MALAPKGMRQAMYSKRFLDALERLLSVEGAESDHAHDHGGATKYGISLRFLRTIYPDATAEDILRLTDQNAQALYWQYFWVPYRSEQLPPEIGEAHFFSTVNLPPDAAGRVLQRAINRAGRAEPGLESPKVSVDGVVGPKTVAAAYKANQKELLRRIVSELCWHYHEISTLNSDFERSFLRGWFYRAAVIAVP